VTSGTDAGSAAQRGESIRLRVTTAVAARTRWASRRRQVYSADASFGIPLSRPDDRAGRYVLVGGLAVVLHGHLRATGDVDLVVDLDPDQVTRTLSAPPPFDQLWARSLTMTLRGAEALTEIKRLQGRQP
jgi:hypothetical protein